VDIAAVCKFDIPQQIADFDMKRSHQAEIYTIALYFGVMPESATFYDTFHDTRNGLFHQRRIVPEFFNIPQFLIHNYIFYFWP
jgi:hypothetical protein